MRSTELKEDKQYGDFAELFGDKLWSAENPFYTPTLNAALAKVADGDRVSKTGNVNRMKATSLGRGIFRFEVELIVYYKKSTREEAYVRVTGQWSKKTGKVAGVSAKWQEFRGAILSPLEVKSSAPSVSELYDNVAAVAVGSLSSSIKQYWDGFAAHYSSLPKNSPPKSFD